MADEITVGFDLSLSQNVGAISAAGSDDADLLVGSGGDLVLVGDIDNLHRSLVRRLATPLGALGLIVGTLDGRGDRSIKYLAQDYGTTLARLLSEPLDAGWIRSAISTIHQTLEGEIRIRVLDVGLGKLDPANGFVNFTVNYRLLSTEEERTLNVDVVRGEVRAS